MKRRAVTLITEVDAKLVRYAELRGLKPEVVVAVAVEEYLRTAADLALRIADARRAAEKHHGAR
jgi:hypothetical protein